MIAGIDEAGRGALAGPIVSALVILDDTSVSPEQFTDSKLLSRSQRKEKYQLLKKSDCTIHFSIISHKIVDKINVLQATLKSMKHCIIQLKQKPKRILIDGNKIPEGIHNHKLETRIGGDKFIAEISAASIIAKEIRDKIMEKYEHLFPAFSFGKHKGYGTKLHYFELLKHKPSSIHRQSFNLTKQLPLFE
jgi:ribonuclease HII